MARVAVIGAGAAGLSAARALVAAGHDALVMEARQRVGGRAWTDTTLVNHPVELGAEFVHGERVATWDWLREFDAETTGAAHAYEVWYHLDGRLVDRATANAAFGCEPMSAVHRLAHRWREQGRGDASLDQVFELWPLISAQPLTTERRAILSNYIAELVASDIDQVAIPAPIESDEQPESLTNFRILGGYTRLLSKVAEGLPISFGSIVTRVRWDETGVEVTTSGTSERFDAAIVTLPLGVLARDEVEFDPPLPARKAEAIGRINPGHISKVVLVLDRVYWPSDMCFLWTAGSTQVWWRPGQGQPDEAPILTAFFGGSAAAAMEGISEGEAIAEATRQLQDILGRSLQGHGVGGRYIAWGAEPHTWMGYSSLPPGGEGLRQALAEPVGRLFFAGEATNDLHPATVHGAIESGRRAAEEFLATHAA